MPKQPLQFGLKSLFAVVTGVTLWMALVVSFPAFVIFGSAVALFGIAAWLFIRRRVCWSRRARWSVLIVAGLVLYVASTGPASLLSRGSQRADTIVEVIYAPVMLLDNSPVRRTRIWHVFGSYIDTWERIASRR